MATAAMSIRLDNVSKRFGGIAAVDDISIEIRQGERVGLIGPNGAGKTTLLKLVAGDLPVTSGEIHMLGEDVTKRPAHKRALLGLGRTFQITELFESLTVIDNLMLAVRGRGEVVREYAERFGLGALSRREVGGLGYGEQRRLELAMAVAGRPRILLLDEPAAGVDESDKATIRDLILGLPESMTVVMVDHDVDLIMATSERIVCMANGTVIADADPPSVISDPVVRDHYLGVGGAA